jgi:hypothetical protein
VIEYDPEQDAAKAKARAMEQRYRNVFGTTEGRRVLGDILARNHYGVPLNSDAERIEYNVAVEIARLSGIMSQIDKLLGIGEE